MDTRTSRGVKRGRTDATPDARSTGRRTVKMDDLTKSYLKGTPSPLKFATKEEMERRENDEVCAKYGNPIIAFEEKTGKLLCEKCIYLGEFEKPVFTATVAKDVKKRFDVEYSTFEKLCKELMGIDQHEVRRRIQESVTDFFDAIRAKVDELEEKTVAKIETSNNLNELVNTLDGMHAYMEENGVAEKYDTERTRLDVKVSEIRYTYVCQRKKEFDQTIRELTDDNKQLADAVAKAKSMIDAIFEVAQGDPKVPTTLNDLVASLMLVDKKKPDFTDDSHLERSGRKSLQKKEGESELVKQEIPFSMSEHKDGNWKAEEMTETYINKEDTLCKRELVDGKVEVSEFMKLRLYLQKVITVPMSRGSRVFLFGGSRDAKGNEALNNCYEVNLKKKTMNSIDKLASPKLSFATCLSPDAKSIYIAGGSSGHNKATNEVEVFEVSKRKWIRLSDLNQPRFSAGLINCEGKDLYCFGGVDNDNQDPTKFHTVRTIETLDLSESEAAWNVLTLQMPIKTSSPGAISLGHRSFVVFGGWNKNTLKSAHIFRSTSKGDEYEVNECGDMEGEDSFVFNGLVSRDDDSKEVIIFGTNYTHVFSETNQSFRLLE